MNFVIVFNVGIPAADVDGIIVIFSNTTLHHIRISPQSIVVYLHRDR